jgi:hypothetical protein
VIKPESEMFLVAKRGLNILKDDGMKMKKHDYACSVNAAIDNLSFSYWLRWIRTNFIHMDKKKHHPVCNSFDHRMLVPAALVLMAEPILIQEGIKCIFSC